MASAVTELRQWILSIIGPAAGDPRTAASVRTPLGQLASRTKWLKEGLYNVIYGPEQRVTNADAAGDVLTVIGHGFNPNQAVRLYAVDGGTLPSGITANTVYYVEVIGADTINLSLTSGPGAPLNITSNLTGSVYIEPLSSWAATMLIVDATYGTGALRDLVMWLGGAQTVTGAKTFTSIAVSGTNKYGYASRSVIRMQRQPWYEDTTDITRPPPRAVAADAQAVCNLDLPNGSSFTSGTLMISPAAHGTLPDGLPQLHLFKYHVATGVGTELGAGATDAPLDAAAYSAIHEFSATGFAETVDNSLYIYQARMYGETGANKAALTILGMRAACTVTAADDGAA